MSRPTRVQIATIAATLLPKGMYSERRELIDAVSAARALVKLASEPPPRTTDERHKVTKAAAEALGYVSRNYRQQMMNLVTAVWTQIRHRGNSPSEYFEHHEHRGWDKPTLEELARLKKTRLSQSARRLGPRQRKSAS